MDNYQKFIEATEVSREREMKLQMENWRVGNETKQGYALLGIKSLYILNGSALGLIPIYSAMLDKKFTELDKYSQGCIQTAILLFVSGIILSALSNFSGYHSSSHMIEAADAEAMSRISGIYRNQANIILKNQEYAKILEEEEKKYADILQKENAKIESWGDLGEFFAWLSLAVFIIGCYYSFSIII